MHHPLRRRRAQRDDSSGSAVMEAIDVGVLLRCSCCGTQRMLDGGCPVCDLDGMVSPPHLCLKQGVLMTDEHGCEPIFAPLAADHETTRFGSA